MRLMFIACLLVLPAVGQVDTAWVRTSRGPLDGAAATLVRVTPAGDIYVAGNTYGTQDSSDYLVLKYRSDGALLWQRSYAGPNYGIDYVTDLAVDAAGNCCVTGQSAGAGGDDDYATVKFLANGDTAWTRRMAGPVEGDQADAVCFDGDGNVFVTGYSVHPGTASDIVTIKYDPAGAELWRHTYNGGSIFIDWGHDVIVDDSGCAWVAGQKGTGFLNYDALVVKYTPAGDTAWTRTWNNPTNGWDQLDHIAFDPAGNALALGYASQSVGLADIVLLKLTPDGDTLWTRIFTDPAYKASWPQDLVVDEEGNSYAVGGGLDSTDTYHLLALSYDPDGNLRWTRDWHRQQTDIGWGAALGDSGYLYVTGSSDVAPYLADVVTLKLDRSSGRIAWVSLYDGPAGGSDACLDIAVCPDGLPVAAGSTADSLGSSSLLIKYVRTPGIEERDEGGWMRAEHRMPTVMRAAELARFDGRILDITGREVADRSALRPGIYFVRREAKNGTKATKVLIAK